MALMNFTSNFLTTGLEAVGAIPQMGSVDLDAIK